MVVDVDLVAAIVIRVVHRAAVEDVHDVDDFEMKTYKILLK